MLEAEAVALLEQLRSGGGGGGWWGLKQGLLGAWGRPSMPRLPAARQVPEPTFLRQVSWLCRQGMAVRCELNKHQGCGVDCTVLSYASHHSLCLSVTSHRDMGMESAGL